MATYDITTTTSLINLLPNATFTSANSNWGFHGTPTYSNDGVTLYVELIHAGIATMARIPYTVGHKLYCRTTIKSDNTIGVGIRWFGGADYSTFLNQYFATGIFPEQETLSEIYQYDDVNTTSFDLSIQALTENATTMTLKEAMVIDLTATYGAGNEPTKEWCDKNIPLFEKGFNALNKFVQGDIINCPYSGSMQTLTLAPGKYKLECWGAQGGSSNHIESNYTWIGGKGGYSTGVLTLNNPTTVFLYAGSKGATRTSATLTSTLNGGFNGGGHSPASYSGVTKYLIGASGGGASDIRIGQDSLYARVIVAGGGGGAGHGTNAASEISGGAGGGTSGGIGTYLSNTSSDYSSRRGAGATQTSAGAGGTSGTTTTGNAGSFGQGGAGGKTTGTGEHSVSGAGGGGGWYGGGGGADGSACAGSGGGGSGYVYSSPTAANYPTGCLLTSSNYLTETNNATGTTSFLSPDGVSETGHSGDGYIRITVIEVETNTTEDTTSNTYDLTTGTTLTNLVKADGWVPVGITYENGIFTFPANAGAHAYYPTTVSVVAGHKYYGRVFQKAGGAFTPSDSRFELWADDTANIMVFTMMESTAASPSYAEGCWKKFSSIKSLDTVTASAFTVRTLGGNHGTTAYRKQHLIVDLTEAFGAGNEPTKEWCDANIPYFEGTYTLPLELKTGDILNCPYSGEAKSITLPKGIYKLECWGAKGGNAYSTSYLGGKGGYSVGTLTLKQSTTLYLYSGGAGVNTTVVGIKTGGFNGGGNSGYNYGGPGGGGTDIRVGTDSLYARVIVAGGGGGGCYYSGYYGGAGGGTSGSDGTGYSSTYRSKGGTQSSGGAAGYYSSYTGTAGSFGKGGAANTTSTSYCRSGGGGGGWYGGGGGGYRSSSSSYYYGNSGGGGGSGYIYTSETAANYPSGCLLNESYYLTEASTITGSTSFLSPDGVSETGHSGDGYIRITVIEVLHTNINLCINKLIGSYVGVRKLLAAYFKRQLLFKADSFENPVTTLRDLPVGTLIKDVNSTFLGKPVIWKIADKNHEGYPDNSVTLITERCIAMRCFDAKESNNSNASIVEYGNNRYSLSNIRQWLNSDADAGQWYSAQHSVDQEPSSFYVYSNAYSDDTGFLNGFSNKFRNTLLETTLTVALNTVTDGGGSETVKDKVFLASNTEVGLTNENSIAEGTLLPIFSDDASRIAYCTTEAIVDSDYSNDPPNDTTACGWWLRTPYVTNPGYANLVHTSGVKDIYGAYYGIKAVRPLCNIPSSTIISDKPDKDGCYRLIL